MFPLYDINPTRRKPMVTIAIIIANVLAWVFVQGLGMAAPLEASVCMHGLIPAELFGMRQVDALMRGALPCAMNAPPEAWFGVLTSMFMHGSWLHIIGNMWFLWIFGDNVEDALGHMRYVLFYLLSGVAAAAAQIAADPHSVVPMVGASGAIGGVMGAYAFAYPRAKIRTLLVLGWFIQLVDVPAWVMLGFWFVLQLGSGMLMTHGQGGVAVWAHVGGFAVGALMFFALRQDKPRVRGRR